MLPNTRRVQNPNIRCSVPRCSREAVTTCSRTFSDYCGLGRCEDHLLVWTLDKLHECPDHQPAIQ